MLAGLLAAFPLAAQQPGGERLGELERRVDVLAQEIERMRLGEAAGAPEYKAEKGLGLAASKVYRVRRGVSIAGYGEVLFENFKRKKDNGASSSKTDTADALRGVLYFGYKYSDGLVFNSEIEIEHGNEIGLEFAYVDYRLAPGLGLRSGLLLAPLGILNELHEPSTFHGAKRTETETAIIPTTWRENGVGLFGDCGPLTWRAYLMNGLRGVKSGSHKGFTDAGLRDGRQKGVEALSEDGGLALRADLEPAAGALVGASLYAGDSGQGEADAQGSIRARTRIYEAHARWQGRGLEARALYALARQGDADRLSAKNGKTVAERMFGYYAELAYDVLSLWRTEASLSPFLRYERLNTQDRVPAALTADKALDQTLWTFGVGFKPDPRVAFKLDYQNRNNEAGTGIDQWNLAVNWLF